jgi:osmotically-inducible protein OsmY
MKSDQQLESDVVKELQSDARLGENQIGAHVDQGLVTLTGRALRHGQRVAAENAAHRVAGVLDVVDEIGTQPAGECGLGDEDIARLVRAALEWEGRLPDAQIRSTVSSGWVTLEGAIASMPESYLVERVVGNLDGVRGVTNLLTVGDSCVSREAIRLEIERALERRAVAESQRIQVDVADDVVSVSGEVQSWAERRAILTAARQTPGVASVVDELLVQPADLL